MSVDSPSSSTAQDAAGPAWRIYLDTDQVSVVQLERKLRLLKEEHADVSLYLRADRDVPYGVVVQVMDGVKKAGIEKLVW